MIGTNPDCPPGVALLADHLDASLAAGEDLLALSLAARADLDEIDPQGAPAALDAFVQRLLQLEASLVLRLLQARRLSVEIARADPELRSVAALFRAQTDVLHDLIAGSDRAADAVLTRAGDSHAYIRSRGMIAPEAAAPSPFETLSVDERFRIGGMVELSQILDFVARTLDLLDVRFGLYIPDLPDEPEGASALEEASTNGEAGPASADSLANVLGMVRAAVVGEAAPLAEAAATQAASVDGGGVSVQPDEAERTMSGETSPALQVEDAVAPAMTVEAEDCDPIEKSTASRPADYRSLASLIAQVQAIERSDATTAR